MFFERVAFSVVIQAVFWVPGYLCVQKRIDFPAVFSWTYEVKRLRNLGYSLLATALRTEAGAQPPGFTAYTKGKI